MKAQPLRSINGSYVACDPSDATHLMLNIPGPHQTRILPVMIGGTRRGTANWTWNGSVDKPTIRPSVLTRGPVGFYDPTECICHSWINDGKVQFLDDCTHEYAGKTMDLLDVEF